MSWRNRTGIQMSGGRQTNASVFGRKSGPGAKPVLASALSIVLVACAFLAVTTSLVQFVSAADPGHSAASVSAGTFEAGDFAFPQNLTVSKYFSANGTTLFVDALNGNVGVGTTTPGSKLEITGDIISKGTTWTLRTANAGMSWNAVTYGNGMFVAVGSGSNLVMTSPDGVNWTTHAGAVSNTWLGVTYGNGLFVAVADDGTNSVMTSPDGFKWTARLASDASGWRSIAYGNGTFVALADAGGTYHVMTSPDGITWSNRTQSDASGWLSVAYGNGVFVAVAYTGTNLVMTSPDGITWTNRTAAQANAWRGVTYGNGLFVAVSDGGTSMVMTSPDGITWTARNASDSGWWHAVTYGNGLFVATALSGTYRIMTSPDGITWTNRTAPQANWWYGVTYGNGVFVAVSTDGANRVMTSGKPDYTVTSTNNIYQGGMSIFDNVGIGTASPTNKLTVIGDVNATANVTTPTLCLSGNCQSAWPAYPGGGWTNTSTLVSLSNSQNNVSANTLYIDNSNGRIGVGTLTPNYKLEIASTEKALNVSNLLFVNGTSGNVGIGTINPGHLLHINSTSNAWTVLKVENQGSGSGVLAGLAAYNDATTGYAVLGLGGTGYTTLTALQDRAFILAGTNTAGINIYTEPNMPIIFTTDDIERVRILGTGDVGIGTTNPQTALHVNRTSGQDSKIRVESAGKNPVDLFANADNTAGLWGWGSTLIFATGNTVRVRIEDEKVGIGTLPSYRLDVNGTSLVTRTADSSTVTSSSDLTPLRVSGGGISTNNQGGKVGIIIAHSTGDAGRQASIYAVSEATNSNDVGLALYTSAGNTAPAERLRISGTGNVGIGTSSPTQKLDVNGTLNVTNITLTTNCNDGEILKWASGVGKCGTDTGGSGAGWATNGNYVYNNTAAALVGVGTATPNYKLEIASTEKALNVSNLLFVNGTSGNVGIGTTSSQNKLEVVGTINASAIQVGVTNVCLSNGTYCPTMGGASSAAGWQNTSTLVSLVNTSNNVSANTLFVDNTNSRIGVGTTTPVDRLTVKAPGTGNWGLTIRSSGDTQIVASMGTWSSDNGGLSLNIADGTRKVLLLASGDSYFNGGNVGIGTASPGKTLDVNGSVGIANNQALYFYDNGSTARTAATWTSANVLQIQNNALGTGGDIALATQGDTLKGLYVKNGGNVGIGTTAPSKKLDVNGSISINSTAAQYLYFDRAANTLDSELRFLTAGTGDWLLGERGLSESDFHLYSYGTGTDVVSVLRASGNVGINTSSPSARLDILIPADNTVGFKVTDTAGYGVYQNDQNTLNFNYGVNGDSAGVINYAGYNGGLTQYRDLSIYNGRGSSVAIFDGSTGNVGIGTTTANERLNVSGNVTISDTIKSYTGNVVIQLG